MHPSAGAGGGNRFELQVTRLLVTDMIRLRLSELGGVVAAVRPQVGPPGYDDQQVHLELPDISTRVVHVQCRSNQPFTAANVGFASLLECADGAIAADIHAFLTGARRLAVVVSARSPGYRDMAQLCDLARASSDFPTFASSLELHRGRLLGRWTHCLGASPIPPERLHLILSSLQIHAFDLQGPNARDHIEMLNRLAEGWNPPDLLSARQLSAMLLDHIGYLSTVAGLIDTASLQRAFRQHMPPDVSAAGRQDKLARLRDASQRRVVAALTALGVDLPAAEELAGRALRRKATQPPHHKTTAIIGDIGTGKTTELERLYCGSVMQALENPRAPIPTLIHARTTIGASLVRVVEAEVSGLGDPSSVGVYLLIDGLDEAQVDPADLVRECESLLAQWPESTVVLASRPQPMPHGVETLSVDPLTEEDSISLISTIDPTTDRLSLRDELQDVLRRPLFAIPFALSKRDRDYKATHPAHLVNTVGKAAIKNQTADVFELLVQLACLVIDSGGRSVPLNRLGASLPQLRSLTRSRLLIFLGEEANFQLAVLTEWFAANALLHDGLAVQSALASPAAARRWRYALSQALVQGSPGQIDTLMKTMLARRPATAAWVFNNAAQPSHGQRTSPPATSEAEAGRRIRTAMRSWIDPWPDLVKARTVDGELPTLGVAMDETHLVSAWRTSHSVSDEPIEHLPPHIHPLAKADPGWRGEHSGFPNDDDLWPWEWVFGGVKAQVERWMTNPDLALDVAPCREELEWAYANQILNTNPLLRSSPISLVELRPIVEKCRRAAPADAADVSYNGMWWLSEGEAFIADLLTKRRLHLDPPWPAPDLPSDGWVWNHWSTLRLLGRLELTTKAALDAYQAIVERHLPRLAPELSTYQLLPAQVAGRLEPGTPEIANGRPGFSWYIEPVPAGSANAASWSVKQLAEGSWAENAYFDQRREQVARLRGDIAEHVRLTLHGGAAKVYTRTPATALALSLLKDDLKEFHWVSTPRNLDDRATRRPIDPTS